MLTIANLGTRSWERESGNDWYLSDVLPVVPGIGMEKDHDKISTDRFSGGLIAGWSYVCAGPKWSGNRSVSTGHKKPEPLWLLRSTPLCAWNALLCSRVSGPTLRLQALARLAMVSAKRWLKSRKARGESGHCFPKQIRPLWIKSGHFDQPL
jgi:hypothetical protein